VPSERPRATQRPHRDERRAPRTLGVAPVARLPQQARASVPWVAPQLEAHVQPVQLVRALGGGPPPHAMAQHDRPAPPRTARPTRCVPHPSQAVRWSWPCAAAHGRARFRVRARHVARVERAETARVRPWAVPHCPAAPGRRVPRRSQGGEVELGPAVRGGAGGTRSTQRTARTTTDNRRRRKIIREDVGSSRSAPTGERPRRAGPRDRRRGALQRWPCCVRRGAGHASGFGQGALRALRAPRPPGCALGPSHSPAPAPAAASRICKHVRTLTPSLTLTLTDAFRAVITGARPCTVG